MRVHGFKTGSRAGKLEKVELGGPISICCKGQRCAVTDTIEIEQYVPSSPIANGRPVTDLHAQREKIGIWQTQTLL